MDQFLEKVETTMKMEEFLEKFGATKDYPGQIELIGKIMGDDWTISLDLIGEKYEKCDKISAKYCAKMEEFCKNKNLQEADHQSHLAIIFSETKEGLAKAQAGRAFLLYQLHEFTAALHKIERALTTEILQEETKSMWQELKVNCQLNLNRKLTPEEKEMEESAKEEETKRKNFCNELFFIKCPNETNPTMQNFIEIKYSQTRGRHLVTTKDVPIGQTLLVEKSFVSGLNGTIQMKQRHCHHCHQRQLNFVPCPNCVFALFCDRKCMEAASFYHNFECPCFPALHFILTETNERSTTNNYFDEVNFYLAFKLICIVPPQEFLESFQTQVFRQSSETFDEISSYQPISHLSGDPNPSKQFYQIPLISLLLTQVLEARSNYFDTIKLKGTQSSQFRNFIAQKIMEHYYSLKRNVVSLWELKSKESGEVMRSAKKKVEYEINLFARGLFPTVSFLNHSCDPNVMVCPGAPFIKAPQLKPGQVAIVSIKPLKKGEELTIFYCPPFTYQTRRHRQERLSSGYNFDCACVACLDQWPTITEGLCSVGKKFCCKNCSLKLHHEEKTQERMRSLTLTKENGFKCPTCNVEYNEREVLNEFTRHGKLLNLCFRQCLNNSPLLALDGLEGAIEFFDENLVPPFAFAMFIQKIYMEAIQCILHLPK